MTTEIGFAKDSQNEYKCRSAIHMDCYRSTGGVVIVGGVMRGYGRGRGYGDAIHASCICGNGECVDVSSCTSC